MISNAQDHIQGLLVPGSTEILEVLTGWHCHNYSEKKTSTRELPKHRKNVGNLEFVELTKSPTISKTSDLWL